MLALLTLTIALSAQAGIMKEAAQTVLPDSLGYPQVLMDGDIVVNGSQSEESVETVYWLAPDLKTKATLSGKDKDLEVAVYAPLGKNKVLVRETSDEIHTKYYSYYLKHSKIVKKEFPVQAPDEYQRLDIHNFSDGGYMVNLIQEEKKCELSFFSANDNLVGRHLYGGSVIGCGAFINLIPNTEEFLEMDKEDIVFRVVNRSGKVRSTCELRGKKFSVPGYQLFGDTVLFSTLEADGYFTYFLNFRTCQEVFPRVQNKPGLLLGWLNTDLYGKWDLNYNNFQIHSRNGDLQAAIAWGLPRPRAQFIGKTLVALAGLTGGGVKIAIFSIYTGQKLKEWEITGGTNVYLQEQSGQLVAFTQKAGELDLSIYDPGKNAVATFGANGYGPPAHWGEYNAHTFDQDFLLLNSQGTVAESLRLDPEWGWGLKLLLPDERLLVTSFERSKPQTRLQILTLH